MLKVVTLGGECACFNAVVLNAYKECSALDQEDGQHFQRSLGISTFHPSTQRIQRRTRSISLAFTNMLYNFPHLPVPALHHFVPAPLPTFHSDSRTSPRSGRSQEEISFHCKRRDLRPRSPTSRTSDDESALAFYNSIFDRRRAAIILKSNGFSLASPVNDGSPPP